MRHTWMGMMLTACWSSTSAPVPAPTGTGGASSPTNTGAATTSTSSQRPPRAPLDGRLQIQPPGMCGGARPPEDYQPPPLAPAANVELTVTAGATYGGGAPVATLTTASDGTFTAQLPAGRYCITRGPRGAKPTQAGQWNDLACLVTRWETCDAVANVPVKTVVAIDIYEPCSWAVCYHGPPPP